MADDRRYKGGDNYLLDDNTGFKIRASRVRIQWNNIATSGSHFNPRQPQDLVQAVRDEQTVAIARPRQTNRYAVVATYVVAPSSPGSLSITVDSIQGIEVYDRLQMPLDNGNLFTFIVTSIVGNVLSWTDPPSLPLPWGVGGNFADPLENQVFDLGPSGYVPPTNLPSYDFFKPSNSMYLGLV